MFSSILNNALVSFKGLQIVGSEKIQLTFIRFYPFSGFFQMKIFRPKGLQTFFELAWKLNFAWTIPKKSPPINLKIVKPDYKHFHGSTQVPN